MTEEDMSGSKQDIEAELERTKLECQKLRLEIRELKKRWWQKTSTWALILSIVGGSIWTSFTYLVKETKEVFTQGKPLRHMDTTILARAFKAHDLHYSSAISTAAKEEKDEIKKRLGNSL